MPGGGGEALSHAAIIMERSTAETGDMPSQGWVLQLGVGSTNMAAATGSKKLVEEAEACSR